MVTPGVAAQGCFVPEVAQHIYLGGLVAAIGRRRAETLDAPLGVLRATGHDLVLFRA